MRLVNSERDWAIMFAFTAMLGMPFLLIGFGALADPAPQLILIMTITCQCALLLLFLIDCLIAYLSKRGREAERKVEIHAILLGNEQADLQHFCTGKFTSDVSQSYSSMALGSGIVPTIISPILLQHDTPRNQLQLKHLITNHHCNHKHLIVAINVPAYFNSSGDERQLLTSNINRLVYSVESWAKVAAIDLVLTKLDQIDGYETFSLWAQHQGYSCTYDTVEVLDKQIISRLNLSQALVTTAAPTFTELLAFGNTVQRDFSAIDELVDQLLLRTTDANSRIYLEPWQASPRAIADVPAQRALA
jgi:hypothetical protein